jgi:hypothetical protein
MLIELQAEGGERGRMNYAMMNTPEAILQAATSEVKSAEYQRPKLARMAMLADTGQHLGVLRPSDICLQRGDGSR